MNNWLVFIIQYLLWANCTSQKVSECKEPDIDFGEIISEMKVEYQEHNRIQYKCSPGYTMEGSEWIECEDQKWSPQPKCLAPCSITKKQLEAKNLLLSSGHTHSQLVKNNHTLEFICKRGYILITPSVRQCINGKMDLPLCIPAVICTAPKVDNGSFRPVQSQYRFENIIQIYCNPGYEPENHSTTSECTKYGWVPSPTCVPKRCIYPNIENGVLSWANIYYREEYFPKKEGQTIDFRCYHGFLPENKKHWYRATCTKLGWDPEPQCFKRCIPPRYLPHGRVTYASKNAFIEGDDMSFECDAGYHPEQQEGRAKCTKNGWSPIPSCVLIAASWKDDFNR